jgi:protein-tyrosine phosphatase
VIDIHAHLLPGIDDGPRTVRESVEMARVAWETGTREVVCTPHLADGCEASPEEVHDAIDRMRAELMKAKVPLQLHGGREISLAWLRRLSDEQLRRSTLGGGGRWLLLEMPYAGWPTDLTAILEDLMIRGFRVVLAHPERSQSVQRQPDRLREAVGLGALLQVTASSFVGDHGPEARRTAEALARLGWMHLLATDAHSATRRPPDLGEGVAAAAAALGVSTADIAWMVEDAPRALLEGRDFRPPRPPERPEPPEREPRGSRGRAAHSRR